ncbi:MAG TPA: hypothetical protein VF043_12340 [Ktedonobacteraceae bacterium]
MNPQNALMGEARARGRSPGWGDSRARRPHRRARGIETHFVALRSAFIPRPFQKGSVPHDGRPLAPIRLACSYASCQRRLIAATLRVRQDERQRCSRS